MVNFLRMNPRKRLRNPGRAKTPVVIEQRVAAIAAKLAEKDGLRIPRSHHISRAFAIATKMAQKRGEVLPGTRKETALGRVASGRLKTTGSKAHMARLQRGLAKAKKR